MKTGTLFLLAIANSCFARASAVRIPSPDANINKDLSQAGFLNVQHNQKPLGENKSPRPGVFHVPLQQKFTHDLAYLANITLGNPPQNFEMLVEIASAYTFVGSKNCELCPDHGARFNPDISTTFRSFGKDVQIDLGYLFGDGVAGEDTLVIGESLKLSNQSFQQATSFEHAGRPWDDMGLVEGVLGLSLSTHIPRTHIQAPSPFMSMVSRSNLERNLFSLRLIQPMEITFGGTNAAHYVGDLTTLPLNGNGSYWQTEARYVALDSLPEVRFPLEGTDAIFGTGTAFGELPMGLYGEILRLLDFKENMFIPPSVDCARLNTMPNITFNLAGHNFTLSAQDYTLQWVVPGWKTVCAFAFLPGLESGKRIILGSSFLRTLYSVFDFDNRTVSFARLSAETS